MSFKLAYSVKMSSGEQGSEFELSGHSQRELVLWLGTFFLKTVFPIKKAPITLDIKVTESPERSAFIANLIYKALIKQNSCVIKINVDPNNLFTKLQNDAIQRKLKINDKALKSELSKITEKETSQKKTIADRAFKNGLLSGIFSLVLSFVNPFVPFSPIIAIASGFFIGLISYCSVKFQSFVAKEYYNTPEQINNIKSGSEKDAFICGAQAKSWSGYFTSFIKYKAYLHPMAFGAGLSQAMNNQDEIVERVKNLQIK